MSATGPAPGGACRVCGSPLRELILDLGWQPVADDLVDPESPRAPALRPLRLWRCDRCRLLQLDGRTGVPSARHGHGAAFSATILAHYDELAAEVVERLGLERGRRVLDIASEGGHLLRAFAARGHEVLGVERDAEEVASANAAGIPTILGSLDAGRARAVAARGRPFDLVVVNHALSHAVRPVRLLAACRDVLAHGGRVVLEFHHAQSIVSGGQFDVLGHAHLTYWSLAALESAASGQGLVMLDAYRVPIHGGSIVATLGRSDDTRPRPSRRLQALIDEERAAGLGSADDLGRVAEHASRVRSGLTAFVAEMRATGRTLAGYGAPARGTTLLNYCGLTSADVPFTVDRSPAKQGYLLPGCRIPVRPVEALEAARPNVVLVLPWPLADEIVEQNAIVRSWAGEFVAAMPSLHRIS